MFEHTVIMPCTLVMVTILLVVPPVWASTRDMAPQVTPDELTQLVVGNNVFACELFHHLRQQAEGNLFFSPFSISEALAMTFAGARNVTEQQMAGVLHFTLGQERLHPAFNALDQLLASRAQGSNVYETGDRFRLNIANSLWTEQTYELLPDFLQVLSEQYGSESHLVDFRQEAEAARLVINQWVGERTEGMIPELLAPGLLDAFTRLVLVNAIYFNASWANDFPESMTRDEPFHLLDGTQVTVPLMNQGGHFAYNQGDGYAALSMPYIGHQLSMLVVLPDEGRFPEIEAALDPDWIGGVTGSMTHRLVELALPKFRMESQFNLKDTLVALGMPSAFAEFGADFTGMAEIPSPDRNLYISAVIHQAFLSVFEQGTEAAAATAVIMAQATAMPSRPETPIPFRVDRPFLLLIRDDETGAILFLGRILNPAN